MKILWTDPAICDLQAIRDFIARDSELYADDFIAGILSAVERLESFPELGRLTPEANESTIREILFAKHRIIYRVHANRIQVLAVIHGSRDLSGLPLKPWEI